MTDSTGTVVWSADYKPFGEATITVSTITNNLRFPGQYYDAETGLNYNYFRDYNPVIGRYLQGDPIGLKGGPNLYSYAWVNPVNYIDPWGECPNFPPPTDKDWKITPEGPNKATSYDHQTQRAHIEYEQLIYQSGTCDDCKEKVLTCKYTVWVGDLIRERSYNKNTKQYGSWSEWKPQVIDYPGMRSRGVLTINYNCKTQSWSSPSLSPE